MTLRYRYRLIPASQAVAPLGGRWVRPRPLALVSLVGPTSTYGEAGKLDTGSDDTIFPEKAAGMVGVDLRQAATGEARVVGMGLVPLRYAQVTLRLTQGSERREWPAWV